MSSISRDLLLKDLETEFRISEYQDYGPNGLQIEGEEELRSLAFAVTASRETIMKACSLGVQALIVHHGLFWKFHGVRTLTGPFAQRVFPLIENKINLIGLHLPLDGHPLMGNAAILGEKIGLKNLTPFGSYKGMAIGIQGEFDTPIKTEALEKRLKNILNHEIMCSEKSKNRELKNLGIITGGANDGWIHSVQEGLDAYLTGEMSEHDWHESYEANVAMFAGGHYATEQFGIQRLLEYVQEKYSLECHFIASENPA